MNDDIICWLGEVINTFQEDIDLFSLLGAIVGNAHKMAENFLFINGNSKK